MSACRSCGAPILWVETEATKTKPGRMMPLDADPADPGRAVIVDNGNIVFTGQRTPKGTAIVRYAKPGMHISHFATCPDAPQHRRR